MEASKQVMLTGPIRIADEVAKMASDAKAAARQQVRVMEYTDLQTRAEKIAALLRQVARAEHLYDRPVERIVGGVAGELSKALSLVEHLSAGFARRLFVSCCLPAASFPRTIAALDSAIQDLSWLLRISKQTSGDGSDDDDSYGLPNGASLEPFLFIIWANISQLHSGSPAARREAAKSLLSFASNPHYAACILKEEGAPVLIRLLKDSIDDDVREDSARALGHLAACPNSADHLVRYGVCPALAQALKEPPMRVQEAAAWAIGELAKQHDGCREIFAQNDVVRLLVVHLAYDTIRHQSLGVDSNRGSKTASPLHHAAVLHSDTLRTSNAVESMKPSSSRHQMDDIVRSAIAASGSGTSSSYFIRRMAARQREVEDPVVRARLKTMAACTLWHLATGSLTVCRNITDSIALLCFAECFEEGPSDLQYYSAMAVMEIVRMAELNLSLRQSAFNPSSPAAKAVVEQLLHVIRRGSNSDPLLLPCITSLGCLSHTFRGSDTRPIVPLVDLLTGEHDVSIAKEAIMTLIKFARADNYLHVVHCKAIIDSGGAKHLAQMVFFGSELQMDALELLCHVVMHVPESQELNSASALAALLYASKLSAVTQDERMEALLNDAKTKIEVYRSTGVNH